MTAEPASPLRTYGTTGRLAVAPVRPRAAAVVVRGGSLLMVEVREQSGRRFWTIPGGGIDGHESPAEAAVRELSEETGLVGTAGADLLAVDDDGPHVFVHVDVDPGAVPVVGHDPELSADMQELVAVAWRPFLELTDDRQVVLLSAALGDSWWHRLGT